MNAAFDAIPIIDLGGALGPDEEDAPETVVAFRHAYETVGFSSIVNHGIASELVDELFRASAQFHALPQSEKLAIELDGNHRGFIPINTSTDVNSKLAEVTKPNQSQSFIMMREAGPDDADVVAGAYLAGPNQWPAALPGFRETVTAYHDALARLGLRLVRLIARALGTDVEAFAQAFAPPTTFLRLLHYPPRPAAAADDLYGSAPHTDFGCITILAQDDAGGLQVRNTAGEWIDVPPLPDAFVVNAGDMLHRWSNGRLLSTPHRVINRSGGARYSCPFFFDPHVNVTVAPLASCVPEGGTAAFAPQVYGAFLKSELEAGYDRHKRRITA